jgi:hypothetical protein
MSTPWSGVYVAPQLGVTQFLSQPSLLNPAQPGVVRQAAISALTLHGAPLMCGGTHERAPHTFVAAHAMASLFGPVSVSAFLV